MRVCKCGQPTPVAMPDARLCDQCRYEARRRVAREHKRKYHWTPELDELLRRRYDPRTPGRVAELVAEIGFPTWLVRRRACLLGLTREAHHRQWTAEEVAFLVAHAGTRTAAWMARNMPGGRRTLSAVVLRLRRQGLSRQVVDGYTARQVARGFGADEHKVTRWAHDGLLRFARRADRVELRGMANPQRSPMRISGRDLLDFALEHPECWDIAQVDQAFFLGLIRARIGGPSCAACEVQIAGEPVVEQRAEGRVLLCGDCAEYLCGQRGEHARYAAAGGAA